MDPFKPRTSIKFGNPFITSSELFNPTKDPDSPSLKFNITDDVSLKPDF